MSYSGILNICDLGEGNGGDYVWRWSGNGVIKTIRALTGEESVLFSTIDLSKLPASCL